MVDTINRKDRSELMSRIKSKDSAIELIVRKIIRAMGYRYTLHRNDLSGKPDIVLSKHRKVVFVHGCFWHRHGAKRCKLARMPKSRVEFWTTKLDANRRRDQRNMRALRKQGWKILVVWECQLVDIERTKNKLASFLGGE